MYLKLNENIPLPNVKEIPRCEKQEMEEEIVSNRWYDLAGGSLLSSVYASWWLLLHLFIILILISKELLLFYKKLFPSCGLQK